MNRIKPFLVFLFVIIISLSCSNEKEKHKEHEQIAPNSFSETSDMEYSRRAAEPIIKGANIRKNGTVSIRVDDTNKTKNSIREFVEESDAQILTENISVQSDDNIEIHYRIKIKSELFYPIIDKISALGKLENMRVEAQDISDEVAKQSDKIELLTSRLNEAKKKNNTKEIAALEAKLNEAKKEKLKTTDSILYSYINLYIYETSKISHAFYLGYYYGKEGLVVTIKVVLIVLLTLIPVVLLLIVIKLFYALIKWRWKRLVQFLEKIGGKNV
jgi:hypothetical protein